VIALDDTRFMAYDRNMNENTGRQLTVLNRITINPEQCGGRPCIRGMRIRVSDVLDLFAAGLTAEQIIEELPDLEMTDLQAALQYASRRLDHPLLLALNMTSHRELVER
jgi:uncharacterized protein (DUF433 family)